MNRLKFLLTALSLCLTLFLHAENQTTRGIQWITDYEVAKNLSATSQKPMVLFFTGTDWCGWCNKLEKEVFETKEFAGMASDKLIFVKLDFPMKTKIDPSLKKQNDALKAKYSVRSFPTIILLDPDQHPIGTTGYRAGGGKQYANHLMKMVNEYTAYKQQMKRLGSHKYSGKELKRLYQKASELGLAHDQKLLIRIGMDSSLAHFFIAERYRFLVNEGQIESNEAVALKQRLHEIDPDNQNLSHYQIAVIDFEACCNAPENASLSADETVKPLVTYMKKYGSTDSENIWRLNMVISQVYLEQNLYKEALKYAEESYASAPPSIQNDIATAIENIRKQIN